MNLQYKVSIVLPVFNGEKYIYESIQSILNQTFTDFELLIIDDGSIDKTPQIVRQLKGIDKRIKYIRTNNNGIVSALNLGLANAKGLYIGRMDADDIALPTRIEKQVKYLDENPDCVIVSNSIGVIDNKGRLLGFFTESQRGPFSPGTDEVSKALDIGTFLLHPTVMYKKSTVLKIGGYRSEFEWIEDADLYNRIVKEGKAHCIDEVLFHYRVHLDSVTRTKSKIQANLKFKLASDLYNLDFPLCSDSNIDTGCLKNDDFKTSFLREWTSLSYYNGGQKLVWLSLAFEALRISPLSKENWISLLLVTLGSDFVANVVATKNMIYKFSVKTLSLKR